MHLVGWASNYHLTPSVLASMKRMWLINHFLPLFGEYYPFFGEYLEMVISHLQVDVQPKHHLLFLLWMLAAFIPMY